LREHDLDNVPIDKRVPSVTDAEREEISIESDVRTAVDTTRAGHFERCGRKE